MTEETKQSLQLSLEILRRTCIDNGVSIAVDKESGDLNFLAQKSICEKKDFLELK